MSKMTCVKPAYIGVYIHLVVKACIQDTSRQLQDSKQLVLLLLPTGLSIKIHMLTEQRGSSV